MPVSIRKPTERECEQCGRQETWDDAASVWRVSTSNDEKHVGNPHCIHEWDINGSFTPVELE